MDVATPRDRIAMIRRIFERVIWMGAAAIVAIAMAGAITYTRVQSLSDATGWVNRTERVRFALQRTLATLQQAESAVRGYFISREDAFLEPYVSGRAELDGELRSLATLVAGSPDQLERAHELERLARARLDNLDDVVKAVRAGTFVMPKAPLAASDSKKLMDSFRALVATMQAEEDSRLADRLARAARARSTALVSTVSMSGIAAALVVLLALVGRRAAYDIRRSEQWIATTLTSIGDGVIATDETGAVRFINPVAAELTGWSQSSAAGRPIDEVFRIVGSGDHQPAENPVARILRQGTMAGIPNHTVLLSRDGREFPIQESGAPIRGDDGEINGVVIVFKDASAARAAQLALQASEDRLRLALEGAELGAVDHDLRTGTAVWNDRLYSIVGYPRGAPVSAEMINLHTAPEDWDQVQRALQHAKAAHVPFRCEHRIVRANDKAVRWISSNGTFVYDAEGTGIRFIGVVRDVTEHRRLESQVRQAQKLDALGTLAGGIAHDFNNILAVLRGNLAVIRSEIPSGLNIMPCVLDMENACNRATALVRQILTFGKRQDQDRQVMQLETVVAEGTKLLRATLPAEINIHSRFAADLPAVLVDPHQVQQVIANLGINSAHAIGRRPGMIEIQLDSVRVDAELAATSPDLRQGRYVRLRFSDNGGGIPREIMDRIFEPFFTTKETNAGTGLGLSVVRGILKNHDAAISVYSEPQRGTRFHLYFPAAEENTPAVSPVQSAPKRGRGERILYLDDEKSLVILAKRMLERMGYRVTGFNDSTEALAAFETAPGDFDLVLTDLSMPGMSGMEVSRRVLQIRPDIPVLLATGYVRNEDVEQARSIGIREVIWKPQTIGEMGDLLAQQLEKLVPADH
jgi:PAS domain S-box-containing protein